MSGGSESSVLFLANGEAGSAAAERAERFAAAMAERTLVLTRTAGRTRSVSHMTLKARAFDPDLVYCVDLAAVPIAVSLLAGSKRLLVVDTGDYPSAFLRQVGAGVVRVAAARAMEKLAYRRAAALVVRGHHHAAVLRGEGVKRVEVIVDAVDLDLVKPCSDAQLRAEMGLTDVLTVGIAGYFTWYERLGGGLGWELVQLLARVRDLPVHGILIGDGPGIPHLQALAAQLGVGDRLHLLGRVPYDEYARHVGLVDVCLLTQTNDPSSWIRTTGKLPSYMAAGRYMLASAVGTAVDILPDGMLIPYDGRWDTTYPDKLAVRIREINEQPDRLDDGLALRSKAASFAYPKVAADAARLVLDILESSTQ